MIWWRARLSIPLIDWADLLLNEYAHADTETSIVILKLKLIYASQVVSVSLKHSEESCYAVLAFLAHQVLS